MLNHEIQDIHDDKEMYVELLEIEEIQRCLLYLLAQLHEICVNNNLKYTLFGGTLLGAVRHKGFIPWDDDVDIAMTLEDICKLKDIIKMQYADYFEIIDCSKEGYIYPFEKFCLKDSVLIENNYKEEYSRIKLYIDIFPIYGYPPERKERVHFNKIRWYRRMLGLFVWHEHRFFEKCLRIFANIIPSFKRVQAYKYYLNRIITEQSKYTLTESSFVSMQGAGWDEKGKFEKSKMLEVSLYEFESIRAYGISAYDILLGQFYGDYMKLPPEEKRKPLHNYKLYIHKKILEEINNEKYY